MRQKKTKQMLQYWMELLSAAEDATAIRGTWLRRKPNRKRQWPERGDVQPSACRGLLGDMFILDTSGPTANYRLAGTRLCALYGRELKLEEFASAFDDLDRKSASNWAEQLGHEDYLVVICSRARSENGETVDLETLLMPLNQDGVPGQRVMGITVPCDNPYWLGMVPVTSQYIRSVRVIRPWEPEVVRSDRSLEGLSANEPGHQSSAEETPAMFADPLLETWQELSDTNMPFNLEPDEKLTRRVAHLTVLEGGRK